MTSELIGATRLGVAALIGLGVGVEREWSGHTTGPDARFAGIRTFLLLGLTGGGIGLLAAEGFGLVAAGFAFGGAGLAIAAYVSAVRRAGAGIDGTTEAAAIVVLTLSAMAGVGWLTLAAGAGSLVVLALIEKNRLHALVAHVGETELHAALQFAVLAVVVLPLLPAGPLFPPFDIKPRGLWTVVLLFSGLNFAGYIARRAVGPHRGYGIAGALGGVISSTAVTLEFSRQSRSVEAPGAALARGVIAACTVLVPRVLVLSAVLSPTIAAALFPLLAGPLVVGLAMVAYGWRRSEAVVARPAARENPLRLARALQMAGAFQVAISVIEFVRSKFGPTQVYAMATVLGLTDMDALTVSMSSPSSHIEASLAAHALAVGILANTVLKLSIALAIGRGSFRRNTAAGLAALGAAGAVSLIVA